MREKVLRGNIWNRPTSPKRFFKACLICLSDNMQWPHTHAINTAENCPEQTALMTVASSDNSGVFYNLRCANIHKKWHLAPDLFMKFSQILFHWKTTALLPIFYQLKNILSRLNTFPTKKDRLIVKFLPITKGKCHVINFGYKSIPYITKMPCEVQRKSDFFKDQQILSPFVDPYSRSFLFHHRQ